MKNRANLRLPVPIDQFLQFLFQNHFPSQNIANFIIFSVFLPGLPLAAVELVTDLVDVEMVIAGPVEIDFIDLRIVGHVLAKFIGDMHQKLFLL